MEICPLLPSDMEVVKGDTWIRISLMDKIQLYPHRRKDKGNTATGSLVLCGILLTRTALGVLIELGLGGHVKMSMLWILMLLRCRTGVPQSQEWGHCKLIHKNRGNIKKRFLGGIFFFIFFEIFQLTVSLFSSQLWIEQNPIDYRPRHLFTNVMPLPPVIEKAE